MSSAPLLSHSQQRHAKGPTSVMPHIPSQHRESLERRITSAITTHAPPPGPKNTKRHFIPEQKTVHIRQQSICAVGRQLMERKFDKEILQRDIAIAVSSMLGCVSSFVSICLSWYMIRVPNQNTITHFKTNYGCKNIYVRPSSVAYTKWGEIMECLFTPTEDIVDANVVWGTYVKLADYIVFGTTVIAILIILDYYRLLFHAEAKEWRRVAMFSKSVTLDPRSKPYVFMKSPYFLWCLIEVGIHLIFPYPWLDRDHEMTEALYTRRPSSTLYAFLEIVMISRGYVLPRLIYHFSDVYRQRYEIVKASPEMMRKHYQIRIQDALKLYFYKHTMRCLLLLFSFAIFNGGFALFLFEREMVEQKGKLDNWADCTFTIFITIRTIGYGDMKPVTTAGRFVTVFFASFGMLIEIITGSVLINKFTLNKHERYVTEFIKTNLVWCEYQVASALLIQATWKSSIAYRFLRKIITKRQHTAWKLRMEARCGKKRHQHHHHHHIHHATKDDADDTSQAPSNDPRHKPHTALHLTKNEEKEMLQMRDRVAYHRNAKISEERLFPPLKASIARKNLAPMQIIREHKQLFTTDVDIVRYRAISVNPPDFDWTKKLTATRPMKVELADGTIATHKVPYAVGHKANILFEALKNFRNKRRQFKESLTTSPDHVLEQKLGTIFLMLEEIAKELRVTDAGCMNLSQTADMELDALKSFLKQEMKK